MILDIIAFMGIRGDQAFPPGKFLKKHPPHSSLHDVKI